MSIRWGELEKKMSKYQRLTETLTLLNQGREKHKGNKEQLARPKSRSFNQSPKARVQWPARVRPRDLFGLRGGGVETKLLLPLFPLAFLLRFQV